METHFFVVVMSEAQDGHFNGIANIQGLGELRYEHEAPVVRMEW